MHYAIVRVLYFSNFIRSQLAESFSCRQDNDYNQISVIKILMIKMRFLNDLFSSLNVNLNYLQISTNLPQTYIATCIICKQSRCSVLVSIFKKIILIIKII